MDMRGHAVQAMKDSSLVDLDAIRNDNLSERTNLSSAWTIQATDHGLTNYYYNKRTAEIKYAPPILDNSEGEEDEDDLTASDDKSQDEFQDANAYPLDGITAQRRLNVGIYEADDENDELADVKTIMSSWVQRKTPQGRIYHCNLVTQETTWNLEEIDPSTGRLRRAKKEPKLADQNPDISPDSPSTSRRTSQTTHISLDDKPLTWQKISSDIAMAIHQLNVAAQQGRQELFHSNAAAVVESIRIMFYASRTMEKESARMQDQELRETRRAVMAALSKLVLSAKMASDTIIPTIPSSENCIRVQTDAGDVLKAVRAFVTSCQQHHVEVEFVSPKLLEDTKRLPSDKATMRELVHTTTEPDGRTRRPSIDTPTINNSLMQKTKYPLNQDLILNLQTHANQIYGSISCLCQAVEKILTLSELSNKVQSDIVFLFRSLSSQISQYLGVLGDIDVNNIDSSQIPSLSGYRINKQRLYTSIGQLFGDVQRLTDKEIDAKKTVTDIGNDAGAVEESIGRIEISVSEMVEQRKHWFSRNGEFGGSNPTSPLKPSFDENKFKDDDVTSAFGSIDDSHLRATNTIRARQPHLMSTPRPTAHVKPEDRSELSDNWYLGQDHEKGEILFSADGNIKGGTLPALVERLTLHDTLGMCAHAVWFTQLKFKKDTSFIATFLLTYRSFCTTEEFVNLLEQRYNLRPPEGLTPEQLEKWTEQKQKLVRLRVFNVIKNWLENYYNDEDAFILSRLQFFTATVIRDASTFASNQLEKLIRKRMELNANGELKKLVANKLAAPTPIMPKNMSRIQLLETDPLELARQLSTMDFKLYSSIQPVECLNKAWSSDDVVAVNVKQSIDYCNRLTAWVTDTILSSEEAKKRATFIKYWVQVADRHWPPAEDLGGKSTNQILNQIRKLMGANRNFTEYREMIHSVNPPCIPFLGIYLQDLTFIEDGNSDYLPKSSNFINFAKRQKTAEVIREIKQFQSSPYTFEEVPELQDYIKSHLETSQDVETLYEKSLQLEPRVTEMP
ncbi:hypothetical protein EC973_002066 [Apophysomyces ossiformis]|uniref:Ras GEF n=1 Tax=Apophysomyces ossiformis TaxID=679940 RepID=A0A8H7EMT1_9FUNG|nr:hypothetical protein EC973_002066 [Apophysomyces ossiformis]